MQAGSRDLVTEFIFGVLITSMHRVSGAHPSLGQAALLDVNRTKQRAQPFLTNSSTFAGWDEYLWDELASVAKRSSG
jgi:hypothetical protein